VEELRNTEGSPSMLPGSSFSSVPYGIKHFIGLTKKTSEKHSAEHLKQLEIA